MQIIVKQSYNHINSSFPKWDTPKGVYVKNRDHYDRLMKENGMVSFEQAEYLASQKKPKEYKASQESLDIIKSAKQIADRKGNVKLGDKAIKALIDKKAIGKKIPSYMQLPSAYQNKGGYL